MTTGDVNLDRVDGPGGASPYPTEPIKDQVAIDETADRRHQGRWARSRWTCSLTVPNDLVVKASSLQAPGAPIGLGALNVTLGGDIRAQKIPAAGFGWWAP